MKAKSIISAVLTLFLLTGFALADNSGPTWYTNWDKAAAAAKKENKPILTQQAPKQTRTCQICRPNSRERGSFRRKREQLLPPHQEQHQQNGGG